MRRTARIPSPALPGATGGNTATDIMTSLIGVMILVLIGILLTTVVGQAAGLLTDPETKRFVEVPGALGSGFPEEKIFPHSPGGKEPVYVQVSRDGLVIHPDTPGSIDLPSRELAIAGNPWDRTIDEVAAHPAERYIVLLLHPGAAALGRQVRDAVRARGVDVGVDLIASLQPGHGAGPSTAERLQILNNRRNATARP